MNLLCLKLGRGRDEERFVQAVSPLFPPDKVELFEDVDTFAERLHKPKGASCAVLVLGPSDSDLERLVSLRNFLKDSRILFVLAEGNDETIARAHKIFPTYISYFDSGTTGVVTVLKRVMRDAGVRAREDQ
jgi:hypothetical protein